jgi:nitroimidazol reductase NimA-like FMN-containing flavoprotein (pyridoxamine 5'-phosphate oxidase superfamily)
MTIPSHDPGRQGTLAVIDEARCWQLLDDTTVGRLAFATRDGIVILPLNFVVFEERIYVRTEAGTAISTLADGRDDVAFEVDHHEDLSQAGWSVLVKGSAQAADASEAERALSSTHRLGPWAPGDRHLVIVLTPREITGRRVVMARTHL